MKKGGGILDFKNKKVKISEPKKWGSIKMINCPACRNKISINAQSCPKCGEPVTDKVRQEETDRINGYNIMIAAVVVVIILIFFLISLLPKEPHNSYDSPSINTSPSESERTRKELEKAELRKKMDALMPTLRAGCLAGNDEACKQVREWESLRKY